MTGVVGTAVSLPGGGALCVAVPLVVAGVSDFCSWFWPHAANSAVAPAVPTPSSASRAQRLAPRQQAVDVVGGDLFGDVPLDGGHPSEYAPMRTPPETTARTGGRSDKCMSAE